MKCQQCGHSNPDGNKFCGECGGKLQAAKPSVAPPIFKTVPVSDDDPLEIATPAHQYEARDTFSSVPAERLEVMDEQRELVRDRAARNPGNGHAAFTVPVVTERIDRPRATEQEDEEVVEQPSKSVNYSTGIGGPSFLGIGYDSGGSDRGFVYDKPLDEGFAYGTDADTPEYLLDEQPSRTVSWRAWALLAILLVGGALAYIQWRASRHEGPDLASILEQNGAATTAEKSLPGTVQPSKQDAPDKQDAQKNSTPDTAAAAKSDSGDNDANASTQPPEIETPSTKAKAKNDDEKAAAKKDGQSVAANEKSAPEPSSSKEDKNNDNTAVAASSADDADTNTVAAATPDENARPESDRPLPKATKSRRSNPAPVEDVSASRLKAPKSLGDKDPLIVEAESYIQGRGVRQNCSQGVNLLREAMGRGNPAAEVKMGALYWSGTCVTQNKVTAYQWFTRAHEKEPRNIWIQRSRNSLWASMSPQEKQRVGY